MGGRRVRSSFRIVVVRTMFDRRRLRFWILVVITLIVCLHIQLGYLSSWRHLSPPPPPPYPEEARPSGKPDSSPDGGWEQRAMERVVLETRPRVQNGPGRDERPGAPPDGATGGSVMLPNHTVVPLEPGYAFDPEHGRDVLVFLHIQKTGGTTFGRHLVSDLELRTPCRCVRDRKKCDCRNSEDNIWTVNRYSTGWRCGLHADWTELTQCVDKMLDKAEGGHRDRRYLYITILRDPYTRYISEFKHVQRGATWKAARLQCDGRQASLEEVPFCFDGTDWSGVSLDNFMKCPHNLANNRQVRMLANLTLSGCYKNGAISPETRHGIMLKSAKDNLRQMAFFGLTEYQPETQYLFERTFGLSFRRRFFQYNHTHAGEAAVSARQRRQIAKLNELDAELYRYAKELFFERLSRALRRDADLRVGDLVDGYFARRHRPVAGGLAEPPGDDLRGDEPRGDDLRGGELRGGELPGDDLRGDETRGDDPPGDEQTPLRLDSVLRRDEYEEADDDEVDDDDDNDDYNHRIARRRRHPS